MWETPPDAPEGIETILGAMLMFPADIQQLSVVKEEVPPEWSSSLDQRETKPVHIKEEQEELCASQEGEQFNVLEDADITKFLLTAVTVKRENDEEEPRSSQLHQSQTEDREAEPPASGLITQIKTETDGEYCGGSKPARDLGISSHLQPNTDEKASDSSETEDSYNDWQKPLSDSGPETEHNDGWEESGAKAVKSVETTVSNVCNAGKKSLTCCQCGKDFNRKGHYDRHMRVHTGERPFACELCGKRFTQQGPLKRHMLVHTGERPFTCELCGKGFTEQGDIKKHMRVHTGQKPFACDVCAKRFTQQGSLKTHMRVHTGEKPFACDVCGKRFTQQQHLNTHMRVHREEKPFRVSPSIFRHGRPPCLN